MNPEPNWRTSSYTGSENCVEVAALTDSGLIAIRDSKRRSGPTLTVPSAQFAVFLTGLCTGRLGNGTPGRDCCTLG